MKKSVFLMLLCIAALQTFANVVYTPASSSAITGGATYCQGATAGAITFTYNTCNMGSGAVAGTALTVNWYKNTTNSTTGGTLVSSSAAASATTATGSVSYTPPTGAIGTNFYYCVITWAGAGTCNTIGSLASAPAVNITVAAAPAVITGTTTICNGSASTLSNASTGGVWSSSNTAIASVNPATGVVSALGSGSCTISYSTGCGSAVTTGVTVETPPATIGGPVIVCKGATSAFTNSTSGGTWTSSAGGIATINPATGVVTGISTGAAIISYTLAACSALKEIAINTSPAPVTGAAVVCSGLTTAMADTSAGGSWSCINGTGAATVNSAGVVTTLSPGAVTIVYSIGSCVADHSLIISTSPSAISGAGIVCTGATASLTNTVGGGTWSSDDTLVASVNSSTGVVTGISEGFAITTYTVGSCYAIDAVTVENSPAPIVGAGAACLSTPITWTDASAGGTWTSGNTSIATIDPASGDIRGVAAGVATISYTYGSCTATSVLLVDAPTPAITGIANVCTGSVTALTDSALGGTWNVANGSGVANIDTLGNVTGLEAGSVIISYTSGACVATLNMTVNQSPDTISGVSAICARATAIYNNEIGAGAWSSADTTIAKVNTVSGMVTGIGAGSTNISYTLGSCSVAKRLNVNLAPSVITAPVEMCKSTTVTLTDSVSGGTWSRANGTGTATISAAGVVSGLTNGTISISYTIGSCAAGAGITIVSTPAAITGVTTVCQHSTTLLSDIVGGGQWRSANTAIATADTFTGNITGNTGGVVLITYLLGSCTSTANVTVKALPLSGVISGLATVCAGSTVTLSETVAGGAWSSADTTKAKISAAGVVTGIAAGNTTISYTVTNSCATVYATYAFTTKPLPVAGIITGGSNVCTGYTLTLTDTAGGGVWSASNAKATVAGGIVTGVTAGLDTIKYTVTNTCGTVKATDIVTVITSGTWLGASSVNWNDGANWPCGDVPDSTVSVSIPTGTTYSPQIAISGNVFTKNLTIANGATLTLNSGSTLSVKGNLVNNGTAAGNGSLTLNNNAAQTITGKGIISNLVINNNGGVTVGAVSKVTIKNTLTVTTGTFATGDSVVLASDSLATARITSLPASGASVTGNIRVMQYVFGGHRAYRFWSHPFNSYIGLSQVEATVDITGPGGAANGFTTTTTNSASCFRYNPLVGNSALGIDPGWIGFSSTGTTADTNRFHQYQGIRLFIRGSKGQGLVSATGYTPAAVTIGMFGTVNTGNQKITLLKGTSANEDYNMVGNPYPSPVDIGTVIYNAKSAGNIAGTGFYVWNPYMGSAGQFQAINIDGSPYYLQGNTCFQVRAADNGDSLNFTEANKSGTITTTLCKSTPDFLSLTIYDANYHPWDMLQVKFNSDATDKEDNNYDARKLLGFAGFNFYSISADSQKLAIDTRPYAEEKVIPLGISSDYGQDYIIKADGMVSTTGAPVYLHDKLMKQYVLLEQGTEYKFTINEDKNTQGENRFELSMKRDEAPVAAATSVLKVLMTPNPATDEVNISFKSPTIEQLTINVLDVSGVSVYNHNYGLQQNGRITLPVSNLAPGMYMVELISGGQRVTERLVKE